MNGVSRTGSKLPRSEQQTDGVTVPLSYEGTTVQCRSRSVDCTYCTVRYVPVSKLSAGVLYE